MAIIKAEPGWEEKLAGVDLICIGAGETLAQRLADRPQTWRKIERKKDQLAVIYERRE